MHACVCVCICARVGVGGGGGVIWGVWVSRARFVIVYCCFVLHRSRKRNLSWN